MQQGGRRGTNKQQREETSSGHDRTETKHTEGEKEFKPVAVDKRCKKRTSSQSIEYSRDENNLICFCSWCCCFCDVDDVDDDDEKEDEEAGRIFSSSAWGEVETSWYAGGAEGGGK